MREVTAAVEGAKFGDGSSSKGSKSEGNRGEGWFTGIWLVSGLQGAVCVWQIPRFTGMVGRVRGDGGGWLMEDAGFVGGGRWLEVVGKALEEGRGESLGCTAAADKVVAFAATLEAPEYPPERD